MTVIITEKLKAMTNMIRDIREEMHYTQEYLAMKLGISQNAYSKIELGYTTLSVERLLAIAILLETDINKFMAA